MSAVERAEYVMPEAEAVRLTNRITLIAGTIREGVEKLHGLVQEAKAGNAHIALGYPSWTAYLAATLGKEPLRLDRAERQELVRYLAGEGMSTRAIAPIVGVHDTTVMRDLRAAANAAPVPAAEPERLPSFDPRTGEVLDDAPALAGEPERIASPTPVTGMDGKTYTRPAPAAPRRKPLPDAARDAGWDLRKAVERLERITEDDRFASNKEQVATHVRSHLSFAVEVCQDLLDQLNQPTEG